MHKVVAPAGLATALVLYGAKAEARIVATTAFRS
jgi:hypothetical protein